MVDCGRRRLAETAFYRAISYGLYRYIGRSVVLAVSRKPGGVFILGGGVGTRPALLRLGLPLRFARLYIRFFSSCRARTYFTLLCGASDSEWRRSRDRFRNDKVRIGHPRHRHTSPHRPRGACTINRIIPDSRLHTYRHTPAPIVYAITQYQYHSSNETGRLRATESPAGPAAAGPDRSGAERRGA